ncbi:MAG: hypothetical protein RMY28_002080 [Nostoc sp. ChiSLP01]|nr:hypothetical protein [Nostoc sp. CmiSLP01]MDZ8284477.1 hypothetical protein [Nostoc sp. ChiSLP01]
MANVNDLVKLNNQEILLEEITEEGELQEVVGGAPGDTTIVIGQLPILGFVAIGPIPAPLGPLLGGLVASPLPTLGLGGVIVEP